MERNIKIALVHDFLTQYGGAERVLEVFCEMFPEAPIYTLLYDKEKLHGRFSDRVVYTSFLQKFPKFFRKRYKYLLPLMPTAPETFDLREFDLVISSSGAWSKGIVTRLNTKHISYMHSPMRFVWDMNEKYLQQQKFFCGKFILRLILNYVRVWDKVAADRPDYIIANSKYTQARIKKYYGRGSDVIYPPAYAETSAGKLVSGLNEKKYFLIVSRLSPYKKIDAVVEAFNKLELPLIIIGEGSQEKYLRKIAKNNVQILGWQSDEKTQEYYQGARAFVFSSIDDFGIAPVEAMAYGVPVIAIKKGGVKEIVIEGQTGEFFDTATPENIMNCVKKFTEKNYRQEDIIARVEEFSKEKFVREFENFIEKVLNHQDTRNNNQTKFNLQ